MFDRFERLFKTSAIYTFGALLIKATSLISMSVLTRFLAPGEYGILSVVAAVTGCLEIIYFQLGLSNSSTRYYYDLKSEGQLKTYFSSLFFFSIGASFLLSLLVFSFAEPLAAPVLKKQIPFHPFITIVVWTLFFRVFGALPTSLMRVKEQAPLFITVQIFREASMMTLSIYLVVVAGKGPLGPLLASFVVSALTAAYDLYYLRPYLSLRFRWASVRDSLAFGLPTISESFCGWVLLASDRLFLLHFVSLSAAGIYSVSYSVGLLLSMIGSSIETAWTPFFYTVAADEREKEPQRIFSYAATYYSLVIASFGLALAIFAREVFRILAPEQYLEGLPIVPWIILGTVLRALYDVPSRGIYLMKKTRGLPMIVLAAAAVNTGFNFALIPNWGMMGAAWATLLGYAVMMLLTIIVAQRIYYVPYDYARIGKIFMAAGAVYAAAIWLSPEALILSLLVKLLLLASYPMVLYLLGFFEAEELRRISQGLSALAARYLKA